MSNLEFIKECQEKVFSGERISSEDARKLFNVPDEDLKELARCANEITRDYNGNKVDVEQLNNIKKNACSEDCTFCGQSAFLTQVLKHINYQHLKRLLQKHKKQKMKVQNHIV